MEKYLIGLYEKAMPDELSWQDKLICARECGYNFVEISIDESDERLARLDWTPSERRELRSIMDITGVPIRSMCLSAHRKFPLGSPESHKRTKSLEIMEKALQLADDLGIRMIQLAGYDIYYGESTESTRTIFEENLHRAVEMAAGYGVVMGFETMETEFMNTVEKSMRYVDAVRSPYLGVYPDVGNLSNAAAFYGTDVAEDLKLGKGHIFAVHLKATKPAQFRDMYFDDPEQQVDFERVIAVSWNLGVRRFVTELWSLGKPEWKENILTANRTMCRILNKQL